MRAVTPVMTGIIIITLTIALVALFWLFISGTYTSLTSSGESTVGRTLVTISSCMRIESVSGNNVYVKNCGEGVITEDTLKVYLNDVPLNFTMSSSLDSYDCSNMPESSAITVSCPNNFVINSIENSVYTSSDSPASCSNPNPGGYCNRYCDYADNCIGQNSCSFTVTDTNCGGDPCSGVYEKLILKVRCSDIGSVIVNEDEVGIVSLSGLWNFNPGGYLLRVTNPKVINERAIEAVLPDSCVLALDFDEGSGTKAYDSSGYVNDGTLKDNPQWVEGKFGKAINCSSTTVEDWKGYVEVPFSDSLNITKDITVEAWIRPSINTIEIEDMRVVIRKGQDFEFQFFGSATSPGFFHMKVYNESTYREAAYATDYPAGTWHHVLGRRKENLVELYIDGSWKDSKNDFAGDIKSQETSYIGIGGTDWGASLRGTIDSVRIYNKALTPDETIVLKPVKYY